MDKLHYLYKITNQINGKIYIGQSINTQKRWTGHKNQAKQDEPNQLISMAIKKYGSNNFLFEVIATCQSYEDANWTEEELIKQYNSLAKNGKGYNLSLGGETAPKSEEWKKKLSDWHASLSSEEKEARSIALKEATLNQIATQGHPAQGRVVSEKERELHRKERLENPIEYTEELRKKMSEAHIGIKDTEETKQNKAISAKTGWEKRQAALNRSVKFKCNAPGCEVNGKGIYYLFINNIRYCGKHAQRLKRKGSLD